MLGVGCLVLGGCAGWSTWEEESSTGSAGWTSGASAQQAGAPRGHYRVRRGDTLYSIAFRHGLDFRQLASWNGIDSDYLIYPGQLLRLGPSGGYPEAPSGHAGSVAMSGDPASSATAPMPPTDRTSGAPAGTQAAPAVPAASTPAADPSAPMPPMRRSGWVWPSAGSVSRGFGVQGNKGLDFTGTEGDPVLAAAPGRVVYSGNALKGYGELIIIKHDEDFLTAYGYNQARQVREGDVVTAGQPIARMGRGPENRPLLHFEVRRAGRPVDPGRYLPRR